MKQNAMELVIQVEDKTEIERLLSILSLGLCSALEQDALSIEAAERYLYSPYTLELLQEKLNISPEVLQVVGILALNWRMWKACSLKSWMKVWLK